MVAVRARPPPVVTPSRRGACPPWATARARRTRRRTATSCAVAVVGRASARDEPFKQEGPVGRGAPDGARRGHEHRQPAHHGQDLVARFDDLPRDGGPHDRRSRRAQARARVRERVDGWSQARRVRADPHLSRPLRPREAPMSETPKDADVEETPEPEAAASDELEPTAADEAAADAAAEEEEDEVLTDEPEAEVEVE